VFIDWLPGQRVNVGAWVSFTVIRKEQVLVRFAASVAIQMTVVWPFGKVLMLKPPLRWSRPAPGQLSEYVGWDCGAALARIGAAGDARRASDCGCLRVVDRDGERAGTCEVRAVGGHPGHRSGTFSKNAAAETAAEMVEARRAAVIGGRGHGVGHYCAALADVRAADDVGRAK